MPQPKRLTPEQILGERGINLIARRFLDMGYPWHATNAPLDAGIDGHVELRDPQTGIASNTWLAVQSKARSSLEKETEVSFEFTCTPRDLDYWRRGNMPVLLVVVRPSTDEAWWVSVKDYFRDAARQKSRRIVFEKRRSLLTAASGPDLLSLAQSAGSGTYFRPSPKREHLEMNLLTVKRLPAAIYRAETDFRDGADVVAALKKITQYPDREWFLHDTAIYSVNDLRDGPWRSVCDVGTVESFDGDEWADSDDPDTQRKFVWMLNECLRSMTARIGMRWRKEPGVLLFKATKDLAPRVKTYSSRQQRTSREVFREYRSKADPSRIVYYRHVGFEPWFRRFEGQWCLEINPTYLFTSDGYEVHPFHQEYLSKIKTIEGSGAIGNTIVMFSALLRDREGLFASKENYPHLGFGGLLGATLEVGINDQSWGKPKTNDTAAEDPEDADTVAKVVEEGLPTLFASEEP